MFFYGEIDTPTTIANRTLGSVSARSPVSLNLSGAAADDLLLVYVYGSQLYGTQNTILSSSAGSNWYNLPNTKAGGIGVNYVGGMIQTLYNCSGNSMGTMVNSYYGDIKIIMKKITAAEIASGVTLRCIENSPISYMLIRGVGNYDFHRNSSGSVISYSLSGDVYSPTANINWPIANTNITNSTQKLFVAGMVAQGVCSMTSATNVSTAGSYLFQVNKENLTGSLTLTSNRYGRANSFLYNSNTVYAPWASYIGVVLSGN
jgi:hypothetical protein